jgi:hypothetical protein
MFKISKRDILLDNNQVKILLTKLFDLNEISWQNSQIPTLINSILSFTHIKLNRVLYFEKMLQFFTELRKKCSEANRQKTDFIDAENLSILHIIHLIKTDHNIAKDLLKILKVKFSS